MNMGCCNGGYHEFNLDWFIQRFKEIEKEWDGTRKWLEDWVNSFNIQDEIKKQLQEWLDDGTIENLINQEIFGELDNRVTKNTNDIQSVNARVTSLENRKKNRLGCRIVMIADSYGEYGCMETFAAVIKATTVEKKWVGGAGFTQTGEQSYLTIVNSLPSHSDVDYVVVFGFYNDAWDTNNLVSKIQEFRNACDTKYPGAEILLINQGWSSNYELQGYFQALMGKLYNFYQPGLSIIHTWKFMHIYSHMQTDQIHPTDSAGKMLGGIAGRIFLGENMQVIYPITQTRVTFINGFQSYGSWSQPFQEMTDTECLLHFVGDTTFFGIDSGTNIQCNGSNYIEPFQLPSTGCIIGSGDMMLNVPCILGDTSNKYYQASCTIEIYNRRIRIRPFMLSEFGDFATIKLKSVQWTPLTIRSNIYHI